MVHAKELFTASFLNIQTLDAAILNHIKVFIKQFRAAPDSTLYHKATVLKLCLLLSVSISVSVSASAYVYVKKESLPLNYVGMSPFVRIRIRNHP